MEKNKILVAGVGGASLGTEIIKCLKKANKYKIFVCDISMYAYGLYEEQIEEAFKVDNAHYIEEVLKICETRNIRYVIPGAEQTMKLLGGYINIFKSKGIHIVSNSKEIIKTFSNKDTTFTILSQLDFTVPYTKVINTKKDLENMIYPCIIKPAKDSGGSVGVFYAKTLEDGEKYFEYLKPSDTVVIAQEYITADEGEFTVGILSLPNKEVVGSIALKRIFPNKLSIVSKTEDSLISSGYTQGIIEDYPEIRLKCENIAKAIGSEGPINIQGRLKNGEFIPFEINPRFSASTYLRTLAGFNEIDIYLEYIINGYIYIPNNINYGYYIRSFDEKYIPKEKVKNDSVD